MCSAEYHVEVIMVTVSFPHFFSEIINEGWHSRSSEQHFFVWGIPASPTFARAPMSSVLFLPVAP